MLKFLRYEEFGIDRKFFNKAQTVSVEVMNGDFTLEIMKGFKTTMGSYENSTIKLLIDPCCKIVRKYSLWEEIKWFKDN